VYPKQNQVGSIRFDCSASRVAARTGIDLCAPTDWPFDVAPVHGCQYHTVRPPVPLYSPLSRIESRLGWLSSCDIELGSRRAISEIGHSTPRRQFPRFWRFIVQWIV